MHPRDLRDLAAQLRVLPDDGVCVGLAAQHAKAHLGVTPPERNELVSARDHQVQPRGLGPDFGGHPVDDREARTKRLAQKRRIAGPVAQAPCIVQERQKHVEHDLGVRIAADAAPQEVRHAGDQAVAHLLELGHGAGHGKEPLPVAERVGVLRPEGAYRRVTHMTDDEIRAHVCGECRHVDLLALIDGPPAHEHLATLIETEPPAERGPSFRPRPQRLRLGCQDAGGQIRAIANDSEQTCHGWSPRASCDFSLLRLTCGEGDAASRREERCDSPAHAPPLRRSCWSRRGA